MRRFLFVIIVLNINVQSLQIISVILMSYLVLIYQANFKPLKSKGSNRLELINEYLINVLSIILMTFTELVSDNKTRNFMGYVQVSILGLYIFINLIVIFKNLLLSMFLLYKRLKKRIFCRRKQWANNFPT